MKSQFFGQMLPPIALISCKANDCCIGTLCIFSAESIIDSQEFKTTEIVALDGFICMKGSTKDVGQKCCS